MSTTVSNWYIAEHRLNWWVASDRSSIGKTTRGKDHNGRPGTFTGHSVVVRAYQKYPDGMWRLTGDDGKTYIASIKTHYNNPTYPTQCVRDEAEVDAQLAACLIV